ncbi:MAG: sugar ABC transporter permease [Lachnospiraceae bacterium]|nr:sugar ABC transporter permease [Lachnospiraceae bacterium]MBQ7601462.1 sugar ABC transporter permease [Lachnospiraceae bacterium]MBR5338913.1 sugar ABC transporter permease [Lachnospiraceae bacterium]
MENKAKQGLLPELWHLVRTHIRDYAMFIALAVIFILFGIFTNGNFLSPRNLTNLINQTGYIAVMAVAMTLILIIRQIDLSVGYAAGFTGAIAAILMVKAGIPFYITIPIILVLGIVIGLVEGSIISFIGVPAFVTTLAFEFIFRGLLSLVTSESGTIPIFDEGFNAISNGFVPDIGEVGGLHLLSLVVGALAVVLLVVSQIHNRQNLKKYNFEVVSLPVFIMKLVLMAALIGAVAVVLASYRGLSWTIVVVAVVTFIYNFMLNRTKLGRHIYGVGGNPEAAALAGINVKKIMLFCFASMGMMSALGGILFASRLQSASTTGGAGFELDAIASCYIGGVSTSGGVGKVTNTIIGALVIMSLTNGLNLMGVGIAYQYVIKGLIFIVAVALDVLSRRK